MVLYGSRKRTRNLQTKTARAGHRRGQIRLNPGRQPRGDLWNVRRCACCGLSTSDPRITMPHLTLQISPGGPIVDILVGVSHPRQQALQRASQPVPTAVQIRALVDTGASGTCVDPTVLTRLGLAPTGYMPIRTPSTGIQPHMASQYDVSLILLHPMLTYTISAVPVIGSMLAIQGIQGLIGRDVLANCLFIYDGRSGLFTWAF